VSTTDRLKQRAAEGARTSLAVVLAELRFVVGTFAKALLRAWAGAACLIFLVFAVSYVGSIASGRDTADTSLLIHLAVALIAVGYSLFVGAQVGLALALPWTAWKLAGPWILVPLVTVPVSVVLGLWICSPLTGAAGEGVVDAIVRVSGDREWLVESLGPAARIGPLVLVLAIPLLLIDLGAVMLAPTVLLHFFLLILALTFALLLGLVPSGLVSLVAIATGYVRRFMRRHAETQTSAAASRESEPATAAPPADGGP